VCRSDSFCACVAILFRRFGAFYLRVLRQTAGGFERL
jgi:hypothetical protein